MKTPIILFLTLSINFSFAQINSYEEKIDDPYLPMTNFKYSENYNLKAHNVTITQVNTSTSNMNIIGDAANEPSIAVNPFNPDEIVIGWRQFDNIQSNFRQAGIAISSDGGDTWKTLDPIESGLFRSDPVLACNSSGRFFYNSLSQDYSCDVFATNDIEDWSDKTYAFGGDKQWMIVDNTVNASNGNLYAFWKQEFSDCNGNFTRSLDSGLTYEACSSVDDNPTRGTLCIDPDGILYACGGWFDTHKILRSSSASDASSQVTWELNKNVDLKGSQALYDGPNPNGMLGQVWIASDHSETSTRGNVYLVSSTRRNDNGDPSDIMFSRSTDKGETWSEAIKINDDNSSSNWQWFGTISTAPNGRIDVVWLDTRDLPNTFMSSLYYSYSLDGGESWSTNEKISEAFDPHLGWPNQSKMGDYFHMVSTNESAFLAWAATFNGEQDIYFSVITPDLPFTSADDLASDEQALIYPTPFNDELTISASSNISQVSIFNNTGIEVRNHSISGSYKQITMDALGSLTKGLYVIKIVFKDKSEKIKKVIKM